ncbi:MAG: hypothetical protein L6R35_003755, partial [Caloplaca aegaea]
MHTFSITRSLGAFLVLLISTLLLSSWRQGSTEDLLERDSSVVDPPLIFNVSSAQHIAHQDGRHDFHVKWSNHHSHHGFYKRVDVGKLDYDQSVCKGGVLYQKILAAFQGNSAPGREFSPEDIENGWVKDDDNVVLPDWETPLKAIGKIIAIGERDPTKDEISLIDLLQRKPFKNANGDQINVGAHNCR